MYKDITFCKGTDEEDYFGGFLGWKLKSASLMLNKDMRPQRQIVKVEFWFQSKLKPEKQKYKILIWFDDWS